MRPRECISFSIIIGMRPNNSLRMKEFQGCLSGNGLDAYVVSGTLELGFLTGFHPDGCMMLAGRKSVWVFLPEMLLEHFKSEVDFCKAVSSDNLAVSLIKKAAGEGFKKVGFDSDNETFRRGTLWKKHGFVEKPGLISSMREVKKGREIESLKKSCRIAAKAIKAMAGRIRPGRTERSVSLELEDLMQEMGARKSSFDIIVASGPNSALPHHVTSGRVIRNNEPVLVDFGCVYEFYHSDCTRMFFMGKPDEEFRLVYSIVEKSQKAGIAKVKPGVKARDVDRACRDVIAGKGYGRCFIHGTGHGIGLEIHESPRLSAKSKAVLRSGMTVTVEPGIYLPGKFGVRIEDSVLVRGDVAQRLTV